MKPSKKRPRILVVDDDAGQRSLLETFLRAQGFRTQAADSGVAALALLERGEFGLIVSDVRMPGMSGIETLRRVRERHPGDRKSTRLTPVTATSRMPSSA